MGGGIQSAYDGDMLMGGGIQSAYDGDMLMGKWYSVSI
jgi:hypothetical protein